MAKMINSLEQFKALSEEERDFYTFSTLLDISDKMNAFCLDELDKRYAKKLVEQIVYTGVSFILIAFLGALVGLVIIK